MGVGGEKGEGPGLTELVLSSLERGLGGVRQGGLSLKLLPPRLGWLSPGRGELGLPPTLGRTVWGRGHNSGYTHTRHTHHTHTVSHVYETCLPHVYNPAE